MTMKKEARQEKFYSTADLGLAAVILLSHPLEAIERQNPRKAEFVFQQDSKLEEVVNEYWRGGIKVEPQAYFGALRTIKARLYARE